MKIGVNGVIIGLITAVIAWLWQANPFLGIVVGLGMIVNLIAAGLAGAAIPIVMKKLGADPAQSSSIILTTVTDIIGFFAFLRFALIFREYIIKPNHTRATSRFRSVYSKFSPYFLEWITIPLNKRPSMSAPVITRFSSHQTRITSLSITSSSAVSGFTRNFNITLPNSI